MAEERIFYITKELFKEGIKQVRGIRYYTGGNCDWVQTVDFNSYYRPHFHETFVEALKEAKKMRRKRISILKKQLAECQNMTFENPEEND